MLAERYFIPLPLLFRYQKHHLFAFLFISFSTLPSLVLSTFMMHFLCRFFWFWFATIVFIVTDEGLLDGFEEGLLHTLKHRMKARPIQGNCYCLHLFFIHFFIFFLLCHFILHLFFLNQWSMIFKICFNWSYKRWRPSFASTIYIILQKWESRPYLS